jgi:hypothetical protein
MPVTWSTSREDRFVLVTLDGEVQAKDIQQYMSAMVAEGVLSYRKLFDARYVVPGGLRLSDFKAFAGTIVAMEKDAPVGPLAIVIGSDMDRELADVYGRADAGRALAVFSDMAEARQWLDGLAVEAAAA